MAEAFWSIGAISTSWGIDDNKYDPQITPIDGGGENGYNGRKSIDY
jgi:hypothetical protein